MYPGMEINNTLVDSVHQTYKFLTFMCLDSIVRDEEEAEIQLDQQ